MTHDDGTFEEVHIKDFKKEITFDELELTSGTAKVMYWSSLSNLIPLVGSAKKMFCFETTKTE